MTYKIISAIIRDNLRFDTLPIIKANVLYDIKSPAVYHHQKYPGLLMYFYSVSQFPEFLLIYSETPVRSFWFSLFLLAGFYCNILLYFFQLNVSHFDVFYPGFIKIKNFFYPESLEK